MQKYVIRILAMSILLTSGLLLAQSRVDTSYSGIAPTSVRNLLVRGKAPFFTLQINGYYNMGLMDLAANDNTNFSKTDFVEGRNFGTRYGYGGSITGKLALQKAGYLRLTVSALYNGFQSNFVISKSPEGKVSYNVFSGAIGLENNFTPDRKFKYYIGFEIISSFISGDAVLTTDSTDFNLTIKNSFRLGAAANFGFEYAFSNSFGLNLGMKFTHANLLLKDSKESADPHEIYLNDDKVKVDYPYAGWKQFFFASFYTGVNFYFGMKNKK
jgi:hypothetical protein